MLVIIPRWEWRTFGDDFGAAEEWIRAAGTPEIKESSELYILSRRSGDNVKIRYGQLDAKILQQPNRDGLEQWRPVLKAGFPLAAATVREVCAVWKIRPPAGEDEYGCDRLLAELVEPHPDLRTVEVAKTRHGYLIDDCLVELADLEIDRRPSRTVAVENREAERLIATVRRLGLDGFSNLNYVAALKDHAGI